MSILFDAAVASTGASPLSLSHTCALDAKILWVHTRCDVGAVTGVTYNGVAMTQRGTGTSVGVYQLWSLINPTAGANNIVATGPGTIWMSSASYRGALGTVDATGSSTAAATGVTTTVPQCWAVYASSDRATGVPLSAVSNCTFRSGAAGGASMGLFDSGTLIPAAGLFTMTSNASGGNIIGLTASFAPIPGDGNMLQVF